MMEDSNSIYSPTFSILAKKSHSVTTDTDCITGLLLKNKKALRFIFML